MLVSLQDIDHMAEILNQIPQTKHIHLVLVFNEQEINENASVEAASTAEESSDEGDE